MTKSDIVHLLAETFGYRRCLVLRTPLTGQDCAVDANRFEVYHQLIYNPNGSKSRSLLTYDIALLDPWHTYRESLRDLETVFAHLSSNGCLVCHDCYPAPDVPTAPDKWTECLEGRDWSGETSKAWRDFVESRLDLSYCTVDTDYGCGIAFKGDMLKSDTLDFPNLVTPEQFEELIQSVEPV